MKACWQARRATNKAHKAERDSRSCKRGSGFSKPIWRLLWAPIHYKSSVPVPYLCETNPSIGPQKPHPLSGTVESRLDLEKRITTRTFPRRTFQTPLTAPYQPNTPQSRVLLHIIFLIIINTCNMPLKQSFNTQNSHPKGFKGFFGLFTSATVGVSVCCSYNFSDRSVSSQYCPYYQNPLLDYFIPLICGNGSMGPARNDF